MRILRHYSFLPVKKIKCLRNQPLDVHISYKIKISVPRVFSRQLHFHPAVFYNYSMINKVKKKEKKKDS